MKITYCMVVLNRLEETKIAIRRHAPHADRTIIIDDFSTDGTYEYLLSDECKKLNVEVYQHLSENKAPRQRNQYLDRALDEAAVGWILTTDCDELLEDAAIYDIRGIATEAENQGYNIVGFNSHDVQTDIDGSVWQAKSGYWNPMFFKAMKGMQYVGETHAGIAMPSGNKFVQSHFKYYHIKSIGSQWIRGCRNYWTTAQVAQNTTDDADWLEFKALREKHGFTFFREMYDAMWAGNLHQDFKDWFILHRNSDNSEKRSWFVSYFVFIHPEENIGVVGNRDYLYDRDRKACHDLCA